MKAGLRIDVDTYRGTRLGVPALLDTLARHDVRGTFFFSVGPDNMGRHLWRLLRPKFFWKMIRTNAPSLYGWDIVLRGTFWPGPVIGERCANVIRDTARDHEIGLHAWDHHQWQAHIDEMDDSAVRATVCKAFDMLARAAGRAPAAFAAPSWKAPPLALRITQEFPFRYQSDCRGHSIFLPYVGDRPLPRPQVPVTLPTYDEVVGPGNVSPGEYNEFILNRVQKDRLNVLCIHAEVEGIACREMFDEFLRLSKQRDIEWVPLSEMIPETSNLPAAAIEPRTLPGREGWIAHQAAAR